VSAQAALKAALRAELRARRRAIPPDQKRQWDRALQAGLSALAAQAEGALFCFVGVRSEPDTRPFLAARLAAGRAVAVPRCTGPGIMEARVITDLAQLREVGPLGIPEPGVDCPLLAPEAIALAVVPCLSCDREGRRLGQGGGYYDAFLRGRIFPAVALCYEALLSEHIPTEPFDVPVDGVLTERRLYGSAAQRG